MPTLAALLLIGVTTVAASEPFAAIVESYVAIQTHLAADRAGDDLKESARALAAQAAALGPEGADIAKAARAVESAGDLKSARAAFGALSDAVIAVGDARGWKGVDGVRLGFCPMVKRSWLQKDAQVRNPYYGRSMLTCGDLKPVGR
jgi:hypothetical protein